MRIKFLSIIASFFMVSLVITSCLDNEDNTEYSPDATIHAFALDTIGGYGVNYKFTIDQISREIYNEDSLPVRADTIIDRILIKTLTTSSGIVTMKTMDGKNDSVLNINDSIDLRKYINPTVSKGDYLKLTVWAPDMINKLEYKISVRVHQHDPDSLSWKYAGKIQDEIVDAQKTIYFKNKYLTYSKVGNAVKVYESNNLSNWSAAPTDLSKLPNSILPFENVILATIDNKVYSSADGINWLPSDKFSGSVNTFVSILPVNGGNKLVYIKTEDGERYLYSTMESELQKATITEDKIGKAGANFPVDNISYVTFKKGNNYQNIIVGKHLPAVTITIDKKDIPVTVAWGFDGNTMVELGTTTSSSAYCPEFENPTVIYYNNLLYVWGDKFESIYVSMNEGIAWKKANKKFSFPYQDWSKSGFVPTIEKPEFRGRKNYSIVQDTKKDYIYVLFGSENNVTFNEKVGPYDHSSEVWRGRLNSLWFLQDPLK